eukprot:1822596-Amphidinium_carterae.1
MLHVLLLSLAVGCCNYFSVGRGVWGPGWQDGVQSRLSWAPTSACLRTSREASKFDGPQGIGALSAWVQVKWS